MKLVLVTQRAPMYLPQFLDELVGRLIDDGQRVEGMVALSPTFKNTPLQEARSRLAYYGPLDFARMSARIARNVYLARRPRTSCHSVENVLRKYGIEAIDTSSINSSEFHQLIESRGIDVVLSIASPQIFGRRLLEAPGLGCLNYHMGMLPRYRGRQPLFWAMMHGESRVGLTLHEMDTEIDNGPIVGQTAVEVSPADTLHQLYCKCVARGPTLVAESIARLAAGDTTRIPNDRNQATYFGFPGREDVRLFRSRGKRFF